MKILHTADLHLGKIIHEQSLLEDQAHLLDQLAVELEAEKYDVFLVAGDLFDRSVPPPQAVALWDDFLFRIKTRLPDLAVIVIPGNHDGAQRLSFASRFLEDQKIYLRTEFHPQPVRIMKDGQPWDFYPVPFLTDTNLVPEGGPKDQASLWEEALKRLREVRDPQVPGILVAHLFTLGGQESESERIFLGEAEQIPASWLTGWSYAALGHLHRCQEPLPGVFYSGSPLAYSFSEAGSDKKVLRVEWTNRTGDGVPLVTPVEIRPLRPLTRLRGTYRDFLENPGWKAYADQWIEVTLTDAQLVAQPVEKLRSVFPRLLSLIQTPLLETTGTETLIHRSTGDLETDLAAFMETLGADYSPDSRHLVRSILKEAAAETP